MIPGWDFEPNSQVDEIDGNLVAANFGPCSPGAAASGPGSLGDQLLAAMQSAVLLVGTDEGSPDGSPTGGHLGILPAGSVVGTCLGDTDLDGDVDVDDLNNVILDWDPQPNAHGGDITGPIPGSPPDGDTDVNDLNAIIVNWGSCTE